MTRRRIGGGARAGATGLLLLVSLLTTALLAVQAHFAYTYHRVTAEQTLRDFARLAGHEFVRRSTARLGYEGYAALCMALASRVRAGGLPASSLPALASDPNERLRRAAGLTRRAFTARPGDGAVAWVPDPPSATAQGWLLDQLQKPREAGPFFASHGVVEGAPRSFVFGPSRERPEWPLAGFELDLAALRPWLQAALDGGPLLPPSVGRGQVTNDALSVAVYDHGGVERFRAGALSLSPLAVELPFGDSYSGVLAGSSVRISIDPAAAHRLVIGGLPRSRLPLLLGLFALSAGLVVTALLQLRRERALQRLRDEFVASVSHELRTPLSQIRMFAETLLLERVRTPEERRRALEILDREARRLAHLVENVLQFSRSEPSAPPAYDARPLAPVIREVLEQFQPLADGAGVRLSARLDETACAAVDSDALRQVLLNLLDNAAKYGPRGQELVIGLERAFRAVRLWVDDEGPGVPPRERRRVFERFYRLERDRQSAVAGTGIGLALVRDLAERHAGRAFVEDGERGGARFVVELPA